MRREPEVRSGNGLPTPGRGCGARFGIGPADRLLLGALRSTAIHGLGDPAGEAQLCAALGPAGLDVAISLKSFVASLSAVATRTVAVGVPCRPCITRDELSLLATVAAAGRGDFDHAHGLIAEFVAPRHVDAMTHAAERISEALGRAGATLGVGRVR